MMIDKAAKALYASESGGEGDWEKLDLITRGALKRDARAVLMAIRQDLAMTRLVNDEASGDWLAGFDHACGRIDAALEETSNGE